MKAPVRKVLFVTLSNLGDVVLTTPVLQSLRTAFPDASIDVLAGSGGVAVLEGDPRLGRVTAYDKKAPFAEKRRMLAAIRRERYDVIVDLRRSLFGLLGGARKRNSYLDFPSRKLHRAKRHLRSLRGICPAIDPVDGPSWMTIAGPEAHAATTFLAPWGTEGSDPSVPLVVVAPGSKSDIKKWPAAYFAQVLDRLAADNGCRIVLVGDKNDAADAAAINALLAAKSTDLTGRTTFRQMAAVIARASLVLTNDSAPLHLAEALNVPTLALFGPTDPAKYGTRRPANRSARKEIFCSPCEVAQCRYRHECMNEMLPGEIYRQAAAVMERKDSAKRPRILVIRLDRIGDVVLTLPAVQAIRTRFPDAHIAMMTRPATSAIADSSPFVDETIVYRYEKKGRHASPLGSWRIIREIRRGRFDIAFILHPSTRSYLVPLLAGIPVRVGFRSWPGFTTHSVADRRREGRKHEAAYTLDIAAALDVQPTQRLAAWPVPRNESAAVERLLAAYSVKPGEKLVALHAGASCPSKKWPKERFAALGQKIAAAYPHRIVLVGGPEEKGAAAYLASVIGPRALDLTGKLDLKELAALFQKTEALVSNDSGPVHVASAVGAKTVTVFGRNQAGLSSVRWRVLGDGHKVVQKDVGCVVCLAHACTIEFECLRAVDVDDVFAAVQEVLQA